MRVYYSDGVFRGGLMDMAGYSALKFRMWHGRPQPGCREFLMDISGHGKPVYEGCWYLIRQSFTPNIEGPSGDDFDHNSHAYHLTSVEVEAWFVKHDLKPPPDVIELARRFDGEFPDDDTPPKETPPIKPMLSEALLEVWEMLEGKALTARQLGDLVRGKPISEDTIRKRIAAIRRTGLTVVWKSTRGYYRLDSPPPDLRESR
ncbi:MAG: hypothetical protein IH985_06240 [Planctomycetes bacterium]|nr:hypothetical protein [Planctomycetota bacterium]